MKKIVFIAAVSAALIMGGCTTSKSAAAKAQEEEEAKARAEQEAELESLRAAAAEAKEKEAAAAAEAAKKPVIVGAEGVAQPDWVYATPADAEGIYASGSAKMTDKAISIKAAQASARNNLSITLETSVKNVVETFLQNSGIEKDMQTQQHYMEASVQKSSQILRGATQKGYWIAEDGTAYVLMFLPYSFAAPETTKILQEEIKEESKKNAVVITEEDFAKAVEKYGLND